VVLVYLAVALGSRPVLHPVPAPDRDIRALLLCGAATVELTKRSGENAGLITDIYSVWELPIAILLPLGYAMLVPVIRLGLTQWRVRQIPLHRRVLHRGDYRAVLRGRRGAVPRALHTGSGRYPARWTIRPYGSCP